jgi:hypothetical protein
MSERHITTPIDEGETSGHPGPAPRDLILTCELSPGDILMMTAAVRDLHLAYPGRFRTDVRTSAGAIWENNPYLTPLDASDPAVRTIAMRYDLIHQSNQGPYHFIHGYVRHLEDALGLRIPLTRFSGDIHLSDREKAWMNQVQEEPIGWHDDFWIIVAGGKYDYTAKWWDPARFQQVVDCFRGRIQFVQCGEVQHWHPRLNGVIDLVGKTDLRQFIRLMYHAAGVVSPVTFAMHLAAAVEVKPGYPKNRACVVVAGGREPSQWEKYGHHRFLETNGALMCCDQGGCWKSRCQTVGDGDEKDAPEHLCLLPVRISPELRIPRCMDLIGADDVIRAIELYHRGGAYHYLDERKADAHDRRLPPRTAFLTVTDDRFFVGTLATVNSILHHHPDAEILVVNRTDAGLNEHQRLLLGRANVRVLDSDLFRAEGRHIGPWELKAYAARDMAPRYDLLIGIDSDCVLCAGVGDVAHRALGTGRFISGRDGSGVTYDESYAPYGIRPGAFNPHYLSTSLYFCPMTPTNLEILDRWARCTNEAVYNHRGPYPGYGDQGVLNSVIFALRGPDGAEVLDNDTWSQHGTYWDTVLMHDGDRIVNQTRQGQRQRSLHCGGSEKFWEHSHRERILTTHPALTLNYAWWLYMLWFGACRDWTLDPALYLSEGALHLSHDLVNFFGVIRNFSPGLTLHSGESSGLVSRLVEGLPGPASCVEKVRAKIEVVRGLPRGSHVVDAGPGDARSIVQLAIACLDRDATFYPLEAPHPADGPRQDGRPAGAFRHSIADVRRRFPYLWINLVFGCPTEAASAFADGSLDAVFIGAAGCEYDVRQPIDRWRPRIKPGGILCGDEWSRDSVRRGVRSVFGAEAVAESRDGSLWIVRL